MQGFDINELFLKFRYPVLLLLFGAILTVVGYLVFRGVSLTKESDIEILEVGEINSSGDIVVEISGEITKPGVYKLPNNSRVEDLLVLSGGVTDSADTDWLGKYLNRAAKITDGQKIYIPSINQQTTKDSAKSSGGIKTDQAVFGVSEGGRVNINTASLSELDTLPGIGPVYAQNIIEYRPYSTIEELVQKGAIKENLFEKIKNQISVY